MIEKFDLKETKLPEIKYQKINPTKYKVTVKSAEDPFLLVMNQRYTPLWKLTDENQTEIGTRTESVDMYTNTWLVDRKGDMELMIEYSPQKYFIFGSYFSIAAIIILCGILIANLAKKRRHDDI